MTMRKPTDKTGSVDQKPSSTATSGNQNIYCLHYLCKNLSLAVYIKLSV